MRVETPQSPFLRQEMFGPLLTLDRFGDEEEGVQKANDTRFGLAASVWDRRPAARPAAGRQDQERHRLDQRHLKLHAEIETGGYRRAASGGCMAWKGWRNSCKPSTLLGKPNPHIAPSRLSQAKMLLFRNKLLSPSPLRSSSG